MSIASVCFSFMFSFVNTINLSLLQVKGRSDLFLKVRLKKVALLLWILVSVCGGIMAMCWSIVIYTQIAIFINTYYTEDFFIWDDREQFKLIFFHISLAFIIPAYMLTYTSLSAGIQLVLGTLISLSVYILLLKIKHDEMYFLVKQFY